jgi:DnaK suppressor protein
MTSGLKPEERTQIEAALRERRSALQQEVRTQLDGSDDDRVVGLRRRIEENDDWGVADGLAELDIAGVRHTMAEVAAVEAALARLAAGTYGECEDCADPIAIARLLAYPTALRCIACQQLYEQRHSGPAATAR